MRRPTARVASIMVLLATYVTTPALAHEPPDVSPEVAADAVAWCESEDSYTAENPVSTASGRYQFLDGTWEWVTGLPGPASAYAPEVQDAAFLELWADGAGASHWSETEACWTELFEHWTATPVFVAEDVPEDVSGCADEDRSARGYCPGLEWQHEAEVEHGREVEREAVGVC